MIKRVGLTLFAMALWGIGAAAQGQSWSLPPDRGTLARADVEAIAAGDDYPQTSSYQQRIEMVDFESYGEKFTQVAVILTPDRPRMHKGKRIVVVGAEPGSEYAYDFLLTPEGREGPGIWLAKRGITFIALTRVGRWNFLAPGADGSWETVPIDQRMPMFHRTQKAHWTRADYDVKASGVTAATSSDSAVYRIPKPTSPLWRQMLAATPVTYLAGYKLGIDRVLPAAARAESFLLYWGMSTGGSFLYPLAKLLPPDGYLGWGTSSTGLAYAYRKAKTGDFGQPYAKTALRRRERGLDDFIYYTKELDEQTRLAWWKVALRSPRFKSGEDAPMQLGAAALTEIAMRLWLSDTLPAEYRKAGLSNFVQQILEPSFPPDALKKLTILDMNGTLDEAIPPKTVDAHREAMEPYARSYRVARIEGFHHYLYQQQSIKVVGTIWLRFIDSGLFD